MTKQIPQLGIDEEAESFLASDLSDLDFSQFKPIHFEFEPKGERPDMRLPASLLAAIKSSASAGGIPYRRFIRQTLERALAAKRSPETPS